MPAIKYQDADDGGEKTPRKSPPESLSTMIAPHLRAPTKRKPEAGNGKRYFLPKSEDLRRGKIMKSVILFWILSSLAASKEK